MNDEINPSLIELAEEKGWLGGYEVEIEWLDEKMQTLLGSGSIKGLLFFKDLT